MSAIISSSAALCIFLCASLSRSGKIPRSFVAICISILAGCATTKRQPVEIRSVPPDLTVPPMAEGRPAAGKRVRQVIPAYKGTGVHHALYLPKNWKPGRKYPVIVEYQGNGNYRNQYGDVCTGRVEDSKLGYGISAGEDFIWVCMPYLNEAGTKNVTKWWGVPPTYRPAKTIDYCKKAVPWICKEYGGDPDKVILAGFSRGSIACNYIGLHDDDIAKLWRAFIPYSVYDGVRENWPYPGDSRSAALERLKRLKGRPQFICDELSSRNSKISLRRTQEYLSEHAVNGNFTYHWTGFRNHNDAWVLRPSTARTNLRKWLKRVL